MDLILEETLILDTQNHKPKTFIVIGCGGTGGYYIPNLIRQVSILNKLRRIENLEEHKVLLIDADKVSLSNLNRQNFIESDLNENKAIVMSTRYGNAFSTNVQHLDEYITSTEQLVEIVNSVTNNAKDYNQQFADIPIIVDCVDNNKTRVFIHEAVKEISKYRDIYSLSSGNEFYNGQVVCGYFPKKNQSHYFSNDLFHTPSVTEMFPEILEGGDKLPTELSCDEAAVSHPQNIMTNITAANLLFSFTNIILTSDPNNELNPGLMYFAQTFDTQTGVIRSFPNKKSIIDQYIK